MSLSLKGEMWKKLNQKSDLEFILLNPIMQSVVHGVNFALEIILLPPRRQLMSILFLCIPEFCFQSLSVSGAYIFSHILVHWSCEFLMLCSLTLYSSLGWASDHPLNLRSCTIFTSTLKHLRKTFQKKKEKNPANSWDMCNRQYSGNF